MTLAADSRGILSLIITKLHLSIPLWTIKTQSYKVINILSSLCNEQCIKWWLFDFVILHISLESYKCCHTSPRCLVLPQWFPLSFFLFQFQYCKSAAFWKFKFGKLKCKWMPKFSMNLLWHHLLIFICSLTKPLGPSFVLNDQDMQRAVVRQPN